ncbi:MAG: aminotransferase class III-fold pyridoxal phosphate-dependent enzyme [Planctomycetales bacterium]|nr:aminotransferase class III-fold pyridoxal phosphate-dependent enzyme [Planctomycetales bacterium]
MHPAIARSLAAFPAGCNGEFDLPADMATVIARGEGCRLWTVEGRELLDFSMGWGSTLPGHARPEIVAAVSEAVTRGANFSYVTEASLAVAEEIIRVSPACEQLRFCASGTESTMYCLRLARAFTGRPKILKFEGAYHGAHDTGVASLFPTAPPDYPHSTPSSAGVDAHGQNNILIAPFNDAATVAELIRQHQHELAGVIVEPLQRCLPPSPGFLESLRTACTDVGALLIFDEVVTGFRLAYGGAQELYGVVPDLVAYGKALGGGLPIGVYGGRRDVMQWVVEKRMTTAPEAYVWTASTLGGNPISTAAASAALAIYRGEGVYEQLHELGEYLRAGVGQVLRDLGVEGQVLGDGPLASVAFTLRQATDYRSSRHDRPDLARQLMLNLFTRGVFLNPMGTKLYLSLAHTAADCDEFCNRMTDALAAALETSSPDRREPVAGTVGS